jgi:hypothetical protein
MSRKNISQATRLKLWVKSGGRCQFKHCNKPVYEHGMTLQDGNFADVAHIIGAKKNAARGGEQSEELEVEFSNLMLLCKDCHKLIDDNENDYDVETLRRWKQEHEDRIEVLTGISPETPRSTILKVQVNIGDRLIGIADEAMFNAMFSQDPPKFPLDKKGISIKETDFDRTADEVHWQKFAETRIKNKIDRHLEEGIDGASVKHLSIFAIAPMPLLMYLGKCVGDTIQADIYQSHRDIEDTNKSWSWKGREVQPLNISIEYPEGGKGENIALVIALSDHIETDKYEDFIQRGFTIYKMLVENPSVHLIQSPSHIEEFGKSFRDLLNLIQKDHGKNCNVHLLPAVGVSIGIQIGRSLLPTKDPNIFVCEIQQPEKVFKKVLRLN